MNEAATIAPVLIFTYGNPSRGDDALGPAMFKMLEESPLDNVDLLTDFQLQIEHALDLKQREYILFIDAGIDCKAPYEMQQLHAVKDDSYTSHAMSPASVLAVYQQVFHSAPPPAFLLTIKAYEFGLGQDMSNAAKNNLSQAYDHLTKNPPWSAAV